MQVTIHAHNTIVVGDIKILCFMAILILLPPIIKYIRTSFLSAFFYWKNYTLSFFATWHIGTSMTEQQKILKGVIINAPKYLFVIVMF